MAEKALTAVIQEDLVPDISDPLCRARAGQGAGHGRDLREPGLPAYRRRWTSGYARFLERPIEGELALSVDRRHLCGRCAKRGGCVAVAVTLAVAVDTDGRREVLGMAIGASEAETFWVEFLRRLKRRGLAGVELLVISDDRAGIKAAVAHRVRADLATPCRRGLHAATRWSCPSRGGRRVVSALIAAAEPGSCRRRQGAVRTGRRPGPAQAAQARG